MQQKLLLKIHQFLREQNSSTLFDCCVKNKIIRTFFSEEVTKVCTLFLLLRFLHPATDGGVVDAKLLGRLLEGVVHCILAHLLLEPVEAVLAALLVQGNHRELLLATPYRRAQVLQR